MTEPLGARLRYSLRRTLITVPWVLPTTMMRVLYGFHVEGAENMPQQGPYILVVNELSPLAMVVSGWLSLVEVKRALDKEVGSTFTYMQEELWSVSYFRRATGEGARGNYAPLVPYAAGRLALSLLDGYQLLRKGGIVVLNAEGDMPWDGRPLPIGRALAWLALHSAAPIVPALCSVSAYDIWPRWLTRPNLKGKLDLTVHPPFRLRETPQAQVSEDDLAAATDQIQTTFDELRFGPEGRAGWAGPVTLKGGLPAEPAHLLAQAAESVAKHGGDNTYIPVRKRGIALLLWSCPVCHANDALSYERPRARRASTLTCACCDTRWEVERRFGKDFRLKVTAGPSDLVGLDMALSTWYDLMKQGFQPAPIQVPGIDLWPGEQVYLVSEAATLLPYRPNTLFDGYAGREPPQARGTGRPRLADWESLGDGRLLLTSHRLLWQGPPGELDFGWDAVRAVNLWIFNTLGITYGTAPYRFRLGEEVGLKWLNYAVTLARQAAAVRGHDVVAPPF